MPKKAGGLVDALKVTTRPVHRDHVRERTADMSVNVPPTSPPHPSSARHDHPLIR